VVDAVPDGRALRSKTLGSAGRDATASKFLRDAQLGREREVDIVVEDSFDGEHVVTSVEVTEQGRSASVTWAEQMIAKHRHLR
jgi:hypothetical protein